MFRDGNNQALQLVMQGYSDSIRAKTSNQGLAMANAFNQGLSNAVQTHDNHEQAMQNREMTRLQNEYMNKTMDDRVRHQAQQTKANDLANEYTERTLDDRVAHQEQQTIANGLANEAQFLNNNFQEIKNEIADKTKGTEVDKINYANKASVADSKLSKERSEIFLESYTGSTPVRQVGGKYQKLTWRKDKNTGQTYQDWQDIDEATYNRQMEINSNINYNRRVLGKTDTTANEMAVAQQQAQQANSVVAREMGNANHAAIKETQKLFTEQNYTPNEIAGLINESERNQQSYITLSGGEKVDLLFAKQAIGYGLGGANGGGIGGTSVNVNGGYDSAWKTGQAGMIEMQQFDKQLSQMNPSERDKYLKTPEAKETIRQALQKVMHQNAGKARSISQQAQQISSMNHVLDDMRSLQGERLKVLAGHVTQYFGGDETAHAKAVADFAQNRGVIQGLKDIIGAASNRDMQKVESLSYQMYKNDAYNARVLYAMQRNQVDSYNKLINELGGSPTILLGLEGGEDLYNKYLAAQVMVQTYEKNFK